MAKKKSKKTLIIVINIIVVAAIVVIISITKQGNGAIDVTTSNVEKRTITQTVSAIGTIEPETEVKVSSQTSGEIIYLGVKEGDTVKANQLLVRIKPDIIDAQLKQMEASAEASKMDIATREAEKDKLKAELTRITELFKKEFASQKELDIAKAAYEQSVSGYKSSMARYEQALAALQQTKREQERTSIFTPMGGVVTSLSVEMGEKVVGTGMMAGTEMMRVSDLSVMNAVVEVDENDIVMVSIGDTAMIEVDAIPDKKYKGVVLEIGHSAISASQGTQDQVVNFKVKIRFIDEEPKLRPGMSCNVDINTETKYNVIAVPLQAVTIRDAKLDAQPDLMKETTTDKKKNDVNEKPQSIVFIYNNGKAKLTKVETGISDKGFIEIKSGLSEGDKVISGTFLAVSKLLNDGSPVKIDSLGKKKFDKNKMMEK